MAIHSDRLVEARTESSSPIMAESQPVKPRHRPIVRLGLFLISHSLLVSVVCCTAGILALLVLPILAKNTYISENALMPGSASPMLSSEDVSEANRFMKEITSLNIDPAGAGIEIPELIAKHIADLGGEVGYHKFQPQSIKFHPLHFFSFPESGIVQENDTCSSYGMNTVGIIRAPRGDGKEAIVLVTPYNSAMISVSEALSLGIVYSVFSLLNRVTWLAKDIIWLAADSRHGEYASVDAWLRDYHTPLFGSMGELTDELCREKGLLYEAKVSPFTGQGISDGFRRAGTVAAALVIKISDWSDEVENDALRIRAEASNGQMPNLDLINVVNYLAVHGQGLRVKVDKLWWLFDSKWLESIGNFFKLLGKVARSLNPQWKFGIPVSEYIEGTATLASSLYNQALGVPTGPHGAFRDFQVDAITMELSPRVSSNLQGRQNEFVQRSGRLVEGVIRSVNNLLEKFHQSFFLYLLTSPSKFISVGVYMIAFALLVAPLPLVAASLYFEANKLSSTTEEEKLTSFRSWKWLYAAKTVFVVHLLGAVVALLPYFICKMPNLSPETSLLIWVLLSAFSFLILNLILGSYWKEWLLVKSVMVAAAFVGLCLMSVINYATAQIGALLVVPMCLMATPLRLDANFSTGFVRAICNLVLILVSFPPATFFLSKSVLQEGFGNINIGDFWIWVESLWQWNSATYIYMCMVHLPCWVLCIHILLQR